MKKVLPLIFMATSPLLFATSFFSGETGTMATFMNKGEGTFDPAIFLDGYFAGQITVSNAFSVRGEFSLRTPDMYSNGFTKRAEDSVFQINELSATLTKSFAGATHTLSAFAGHLETPGSQQYIMRHLGTERFSSLLTETYLGQVGAMTYPLHGYGGAYSATLKRIPLSAGITISRNPENFEDEPQMNGDFHLAGAFRYLTFDFVGGVGAPLSTIDANGDKVFLLIDTLYYHMGLDVLLGNKASPFSIFAQYGFEYLPVKSPDTAKSLIPSEIYLLVEPRFDFGGLKMHLTAYSLPKESVVKNLFFIEDTLGASMTVFSDSLFTPARNYTAGFNIMVSFEDKYFNDLEDKDFTDNMNIKFSPFTEIDVSGGKLKMVLQVGAMKLSNSKANAVKLNIGYKKEL